MKVVPQTSTSNYISAPAKFWDIPAEYWYFILYRPDSEGIRWELYIRRWRGLKERSRQQTVDTQL